MILTKQHGNGDFFYVFLAVLIKIDMSAQKHHQRYFKQSYEVYRSVIMQSLVLIILKSTKFYQTLYQNKLFHNIFTLRAIYMLHVTIVEP